MAKGQVFYLQGRTTLEARAQCGKKGQGNKVFIGLADYQLEAAKANDFSADRVFDRDSRKTDEKVPKDAAAPEKPQNTA